MEIITSDAFKQLDAESETNRNEEIDKVVLSVIEQVKSKKDAALFDYAQQFDGVSLDQLQVSKAELQASYNKVSDHFIESIQVAKQNIATFHEAQVEKSWFFHKDDGVMLGQQVTPIERVGIYVPGGKAAYPSTVLMNVIPAKIAKVNSIAIATPPGQDGAINPHVLVAAQEAGVETIYKMGGAQAVAAFAYGTETVQKVDKIVGPGNDYVARAKKWVYGDVAIDMIAGPSEICVVADDTARADFVAADLLSQAEHDEAATSICITLDEEKAASIQADVTKQLEILERKDVAKVSIEQNGKIIVANSLEDAFDLVNEIAPEHLQLMIKDATNHLANVKNAGAIFLGNYSPEPLGDYMAGPNHTLPTSGTAKFASPLGVYDFIKKSSIIHYSETALQKEAAYIETIATMEGLEAHAKSIALRRNNDN